MSKKIKSKAELSADFVIDRCERVGSNYIACVVVSNKVEIANEIAQRIIDRLHDFKAREHQGDV